MQKGDRPMAASLNLSEEELQLFLEELDEQIQILEDGFLSLEKGGREEETVHGLFRAAHTVKGSSAAVGHQQMTALTHAMENDAALGREPGADPRRPGAVRDRVGGHYPVRSRRTSQIGGSVRMSVILIVDDSDFMRTRTRQLLAGDGFSTFEAGNGREAVAKYQEHRPDLVLMDITMPVMDGLTAVREIRKLDPQARVVICSALGQQATVLEPIKSGTKDFIVKPFQPERVLATVRKVLGT